VATNQSGLASGLFDLLALNEIHGTMVGAVDAAGGRIDRIVFCPHGPGDGCDCRKPAPGLLRQLAEHYGVSLQGVPFIGDSLRDLEAARAVGARGILVRSGNGRATEQSFGNSGSGFEVFDDLLQAARFLVSGKER
jgi:D-glycero-D-manno-heptose 1,7-bisphosphate phosphatase